MSSQTLLGYYSQSLCDSLSPKYGSQLESLFRIEKLQLIAAIAAWMVHCEETHESDWMSLGEHAEDFVNSTYDAFDIVQNECNFTEPQAAMPLLKALVAQLDYGIWLKQ